LTMRRLPDSPWGALLLLVIVALLSPVVEARVMRMALAPGDPAPNFRGTTPSGERVIADYAASRLTVVNFWATWCEPCKDEMPALQRLHDERSGDGLTILGVVLENIDNGPLQAFVDDMGVGYTVLVPRAGVGEKWGGVGIMPTTFLVDQQGKILRRYVGATPEQIDGLVFDIVAALEGRPMGPVIVPDVTNAASEEQRPRE